MIKRVKAIHKNGDEDEFLVAGKDDTECIEKARVKARAIFGCPTDEIRVKLKMEKEKDDPSQTKMPFVEG